MNVLGLDIGGANIKAAWGAINAKGGSEELLIQSTPFALWRSPDRLAQMLSEVAASLRPFDALAVTMTGELCDCFATRQDGVAAILDAVESFAAKFLVRIWSTQAGYVTPSMARTHWRDVASANWHVMARHMARMFDEGTVMVVDTGSTTTDIVLLEHGDLCAVGMTDAKRLKTGGLVYTGVRRTPLASIMSDWIEGGERPHRIMAETFATTADVYTLLGDLPERPADCETCDGRPMTRQDAANRVLRMVGSDHSMGSMEEAVTWARRFARRQVEMIASAISALVQPGEKVQAVACGSGAFLAERAICSGLQRKFELIRYREVMGEAASEAACAVALVAMWGDATVGVRGL